MTFAAHAHKKYLEASSYRMPSFYDQGCIQDFFYGGGGGMQCHTLVQPLRLVACSPGKLFVFYVGF